MYQNHSIRRQQEILQTLSKVFSALEDVYTILRVSNNYLKTAICVSNTSFIFYHKNILKGPEKLKKKNRPFFCRKTKPQCYLLETINVSTHTHRACGMCAQSP